ncbi:uncharacterized protein LOC132277950 [Cornus florida]|uniref:uncharacterized protein LOC132277950 n=1 Tax=Cornus florida TaxID=4283 RepID=UPI0028964853|nr:uncharacterized protein LOC132277950 [Cornus florida]
MGSTILDMSCFSFSFGNNWSLTSSRRSRLRISQVKTVGELRKTRDKTDLRGKIRNVMEDNLIISDSHKSMLDISPPLVSALQALAEQDAASFHFPGHNRGLAAPSSLTRLIGFRTFLHDLNLPPSLSPKRSILDAQEQAAKLFGASETWFLVGGTTCGIHTAIMATCSPGDSLIIPRNSHISAISAIVLSGVVPKYIIPEYDFDWDIAGGITALQA